MNEPVPVRETFKAFEEGKTIYCDYLENKSYYDFKPDVRGHLEDQFGKAVTVEEILYGKWFIEEEN